MSIRYAHRQHGTLICGGTADPWRDDDITLAIKIATPPTWNFTEVDGWTLDIWFHGKWFATLAVDDSWNEEMLGYHNVFIADPRDSSWTPRLVDCLSWKRDVTYLDRFSDEWMVMCKYQENMLSLRIFSWLSNDICAGDPYAFYDTESVLRMLPHVKQLHVGWSKVRRQMKLRSTVLYWEELTRHQMEPGGTAYLRDMAALSQFSFPM